MEIFKDIPGYEGLYQVSNTGTVKALQVQKLRGRGFQVRPEKTLRHQLSSNGYLKITLFSDNKRVDTHAHRLVALTFIPNPENKKTVNHKNGIKTDNRVENLEWATCKEQINHADNTGLRKVRGEDCKLSKLKELDIIAIRNSTEPTSNLATTYKVNRTCIHKIRKNEIWRHIA